MPNPPAPVFPVDEVWEAALLVEDTLGGYGEYRRGSSGESRFVLPVAMNGQYRLTIGIDGDLTVLANGTEYPIRSWTRDPQRQIWELFVNEEAAARSDDEIRVTIDAGRAGGMIVEIHCANIVVSRWHEADAFGAIVWNDEPVVAK
jgi:hypothetical protein